MKCKKCETEFENKYVSKKFLDKNKEKYENCKECRKIKKCKFCEKEFKHHQNQTCSKECAEGLKKKTLLKSCGTTHNFHRNSKSRKKWEKKLKDEKGIVNIFQLDSVKEKIKKTNLEKYGVENPSQSEVIKKKKINTLKKTLLKKPNLYKDNWKKLHNYFMEKIGYDPRLHSIGKASKESLIIFKPLIDWCIEEGIDYNDIYIGYDGKNEYFINFDKKLQFYDFTIKSKKIIIEFNGIAFHPKEGNFDWRNPFTNENYEECLNKDNFKINIAKNVGFDILIIWSDEDPIVNLEYCKRFIKNKLEDEN